MSGSEILDTPEFEREFDRLVAILKKAKGEPLTEYEIGQVLEIALRRTKVNIFNPTFEEDSWIEINSMLSK